MTWEAQESFAHKDKSSKQIRFPHDGVLAKITLIPTKQGAREQKSKQKDLAQKTTGEKLHELVWAVHYKDTVKRTTCNFHPTDDNWSWILTFFPRLNKTVGEKVGSKSIHAVKISICVR